LHLQAYIRVVIEFVKNVAALEWLQVPLVYIDFKVTSLKSNTDKRIFSTTSDCTSESCNCLNNAEFWIDTVRLFYSSISCNSIVFLINNICTMNYELQHLYSCHYEKSQRVQSGSYILIDSYVWHRRKWRLPYLTFFLYGLLKT